MRGLKVNCVLVLLTFTIWTSGCVPPQRNEAQPKSVENAAQVDDQLKPSTLALDADCAHSGELAGGGVQFMTLCPASSASPDTRWRLVMGKETEAGASVSIEEVGGSARFPVPDLSDGMPFVLMWSPRSNWFLVNHHVGSFMDRPEVYEITDRGVIAHDRFRMEGLRLAQRKFACLPRIERDWASGSAIRWSRDGRRVAWIFITRTDICRGEYGGKAVSDAEQWRPFLMISDVESGAIVPGSVRIMEDLDKFEMPNDGPYRVF